MLKFVDGEIEAAQRHMHEGREANRLIGMESSEGGERAYGLERRLEESSGREKTQESLWTYFLKERLKKKMPDLRLSRLSFPKSLALVARR